MKTFFVTLVLLVICYFAFRSLIKSFKGEDECCDCNKSCKGCSVLEEK
ncbi:MAG: FeoB-associated Cys-rich membrane protein [Campylobacteraceae bacterium]|nr:FeoB-associated Cys-rich membrane protein [Campylobacteraceae bacterium]